MTDVLIELIVIDKNTWNHLTVWNEKWVEAHLKMLSRKCVYMYKQDLTLNNLQWLICHKTQQNQT